MIKSSNIPLSSKVGKFKTFNLSLFSKSSNFHTISVNLLRTFSTGSMLFFRCGYQTFSHSQFTVIPIYEEDFYPIV